MTQFAVVILKKKPAARRKKGARTSDFGDICKILQGWQCWEADLQTGILGIHLAYFDLPNMLRGAAGMEIMQIFHSSNSDWRCAATRPHLFGRKVLEAHFVPWNLTQDTAKACRTSWKFSFHTPWSWYMICLMCVFFVWVLPKHWKTSGWWRLKTGALQKRGIIGLFNFFYRVLACPKV